MTDTVYDTTVVSFSNADLEGRQKDNQLNARLTYLEDFLRGYRVALYNDKLSREYTDHLHEIRNDVVEGFIDALDRRGRRSASNKLSRPDYVKSRGIGWPSHDQHLLAAALEGSRTHILVTEDILSGCAARVKREFGFTVIKT